MHQLYRVQKIGNTLNFLGLTIKCHKMFIPEITHNINYDVVKDAKIRTTRDSMFRHNIKTSLNKTKKPVC